MALHAVTFWDAPEVNPVNGKARSIPILNPMNKYGRVYFFSWFGFMIAFLSWYAFPPLLPISIKKDLHLSQNEIANSNIIALTATLLVRLVAGPSCDHFGSRVTFAACLFLGSIPTVLAGTIHNAAGLYVLRFFIGILGGTFVPCQVWTTGFFDMNVVGLANSLTAGWGNAGGGITYFVMPAIFDSLVRRYGLSSHAAWRVAFIVPFILIFFVALGLLLLCQDTPTGKWTARELAVPHDLETHGVSVDSNRKLPSQSSPAAGIKTPAYINDKSLGFGCFPSRTSLSSPDTGRATMNVQKMLESARGEVVHKPTLREATKVILSPQTATIALCYFCSFGAELAINSILGSYYLTNFPHLGQTGTGLWAAMFGLLNVVFRPLGGFLADMFYTRTHSVWSKKILLHTVAILCGAMQMAIGFCNPRSEGMMFGLVVGMAFFLEAGNGINFALVPHVHPFANGIISGTTGAMGNLGGIVFAIIFRYLGTDYAKTMWLIGVITIGVNFSLCWIKPIPTGQIGGR